MKEVKQAIFIRWFYLQKLAEKYVSFDRFPKRFCISENNTTWICVLYISKIKYRDIILGYTNSIQRLMIWLTFLKQWSSHYRKKMEKRKTHLSIHTSIWVLVHFSQIWKHAPLLVQSPVSFEKRNILLTGKMDLYYLTSKLCPSCTESSEAVCYAFANISSLVTKHLEMANVALNFMNGVIMPRTWMLIDPL